MNSEIGGQTGRLGLSATAHDVLSVLREGRAGLMADIDGTISPLAPTPDAASVSPSCRRHLSQLAGRLALVAIISGRSAADSQRLVGATDLVYVGNHGLESLADSELTLHHEARPYRCQIAALVRDLETFCAEAPGVLIEDKGITASIHYRLAANPTEIRLRLLAALAGSPLAQGLWITEGKKVIEIRPPVRADKGTALCALIDRYALQSAVYIGDDLTDLDAFNALARLRSERLFRSRSIAVVGTETPDEIRHTADLCLNGVPEVEQLLSELVGALTP